MNIRKIVNTKNTNTTRTSLLVSLLFGIMPALIAPGCGGAPSTPSTPPPTTVPVLNTPPPTTLPPFLAQCGAPTPPALAGMKLKIHIDNGFKKQLDSKPIVANVDGYCGKVGFGSSVKYCETRKEGDLQREACDALVVGKADTGRVGPTWSRNGKPCLPPGDTGGDPGCVGLENQFLIIARGPGNYLACASEEWPVAAGESRCGGFELQ
jgi:hypothetical protein